MDDLISRNAVQSRFDDAGRGIGPRTGPVRTRSHDKQS